MKEPLKTSALKEGAVVVDGNSRHKRGTQPKENDMMSRNFRKKEW
jgi:hypothetical protein